jgi:hypothetical protein
MYEKRDISVWIRFMFLLNSARTNGRLSLQDRRKKLGEYTNDYISGKIDSREFRQAEQEYMTDYNAVVREMGSITVAVRVAARCIANRIMTVCSKVG